MFADVLGYWRRHGMAATARHAARVLLKEPLTYNTEELLQRRFLALCPLPIAMAGRGRPRLNLVTDTINPPHLYGGVGTAMIFAVLLAERLGWGLRIITHVAPPDKKNFAHVLQVAGIHASVPVEFAYSVNGSDQKLEAGEDDLFLTTSWWTTCSTKQTVPANRIIYLLQEDERMFYPHGDEQLRCSETLSSPDITFLINTKLLFDHLTQSGLPHVARRGVWFEPSFSDYMFYASENAAPRPPYRFLYYARPNNVRNLFYRGIEVIERAVATGVLCPEQWKIYFVGKDIPRIKLNRGFEPQIYENLSWQSYAALVRKMDLGMCLMYTPHPSYPPLDLAASGAVVVTNRFGGKKDLEQYSKNIICTEPSVEDLVHGLARGVQLAQDIQTRQANYRQNNILRDWRVSFAGPLDALARMAIPA